MSIAGHFKTNEPSFYGVDEPEVQGLLKRVLKPGDWAIDGGANCGIFTVAMAQLVGPTGRVLAFEPGENNVGLLEQNVRAAGCQNVEIIQKALWSKSETVRLHMHADGSKNSLAPHSGTHGSADIEAVTLDDYVSMSLLGRLRLLKLDIEGAEMEALKDAERLLTWCPYVVCEANMEALPKFGSNIDLLCNFMRRRDYHAFILHPTDRLPTYVPPGVEIIPYNSTAGCMKLNFNLLFTTFHDLKEAWPKAVCG
jgi:FkbM family methyltransferase